MNGNFWIVEMTVGGIEDRRAGDLMALGQVGVLALQRRPVVARRRRMSIGIEF